MEYREDSLTPSEALYAFCAWISTRDQQIAIGSSSECGILVELIEQFRQANNLPPPRHNYQIYLKHPSNKVTESK